MRSFQAIGTSKNPIVGSTIAESRNAMKLFFATLKTQACTQMHTFLATLKTQENIMKKVNSNETGSDSQVCHALKLLECTWNGSIQSIPIHIATTKPMLK